MIKKFELTNWKSFAKSQLYLDPLTVLIGANASGKSNALDGLLFLHRIASGISLTEALLGNTTLPALRGGLELAALKGSNTFTLSVMVEGLDKRTDFLYSLQAKISESKCTVLAESLERYRYPSESRKNSPTRITLFSAESPGEGQPTVAVVLYKKTSSSPRQLLPSHAILSQLARQPLREEIKEGVEQLSTLLNSIFILDPIPANMRGFSSFAETLNGDASNIAGVIATFGEVQKQELSHAVEHYMRHLPERDIQAIWAEPVGRFQTDAILYCREKWAGDGLQEETVDSRGMSDGTLRFFAILTALISRPRRTLLVIEEVDNGLHPSRANLLVGMLREVGRRKEIDILVTTHNPALLDALGPAMIPFITVAHRDHSSGYSQLTLLENVSQLPKLLAKCSMGGLSSSGRLEHTLSGQNGDQP